MESQLVIAEHVNISSVYSVYQHTPFSVRFVTNAGVLYEVGFTIDYSLGIDGVYQFYIQNVNQVIAPRDEKVRKTVIAVIEDFFNTNEYAMLYVCDVSDGRQGARSRLFRQWFETYGQREGYHLMSAESSYEGETYYASLLIRRTNPMYQQFADSFAAFEESVQQKLS